MKQPPLVGKDVMGANGERLVKLYTLTPEMINKLGKYKENYDSCVDALKRYSLSCELYNQAEHEYGKAVDIQTKLTKVQTHIDLCANNTKEIKTVFQNLDKEFKSIMQEQLVDEIPVLKSSVGDNRPLMDPIQIAEVTEVLLTFKKKL